MIKVKTNIGDVVKKLKLTAGGYNKLLKKLITIQSRLTQTYVRQNFFGNKTEDTKLRNRSSQLKLSVQARKTITIGNTVKGGIRFGKIYSWIHVGDKGKVKTIRPKNVNWLTIPLPAAQTKAGVTSMGANQYKKYEKGAKPPYTFIKKSKSKKNLVIVQFVGKDKKLIPLFILKKKVKVKARIYPKTIIKFMREGIAKEIKNAAREVVKNP